MLMRRNGIDLMQTNTVQPILLGSGREISKAALFNALHCGGWFAFGLIWFAAGVSSLGPWPTALNELSWIVCGAALTLGFRGLYRRARSARRSYRMLVMLALALSV